MIIYPNLDEMKEKMWEIFIRKYEKVTSNPNTNQFEKIFCNISVFPERHLRVKIKHSNGIKKIYTKDDALEEKLTKISDENKLSFDQAYATKTLQDSFTSREKKKNVKFPVTKDITSGQKPIKETKVWVPKQEKVGFLDFDTNVLAIPGNNVSILDVLGKLIVTDDEFPDDDIDQKLTRLKMLERQLIENDIKIQESLRSFNEPDKCIESKEFGCQTESIQLSSSQVLCVDVKSDTGLITSEMFDKKRQVFVKLFRQRMRDLQIAVLHGNEVIDFDVSSYSQCLEKINDLTMVCSRVNARKAELRGDNG